MGTTPKGMGRGLGVSRAGPGLGEGHTGSPGGTMRHSLAARLAPLWAGTRFNPAFCALLTEQVLAEAQVGES